jgi:putative tryptophan/tyrosine transport system substrate-binding protein
MSRKDRTMMHPMAVLLGAVTLLAGCGAGDRPAGGATRAGLFEVGVFQIASAPVIDDIVDGFKDSFLDSTGLGPGSVEFVHRNAQGDSSLIQSIARELAGRDLDMIAVVGTPAVLAQAEVEAEVPIVALAMGDPVEGGVADSLDVPGGNVTGSIDYLDPGLAVAELVAIEPGVRRIGTVFDPSNDNMQVWLDDLRPALDHRELALVEAPIGSSADVVTAARSLGGRVDAVLIGPDTTVISSIDAVGAFARDERLGLYGVAIEAGTPGVLAALGPDYHEVGRLAGAAAADVHAGVDPGRIPFRRPGALRPVLNTTTADRLGLDLPPDVLGRAILVAG